MNKLLSKILNTDRFFLFPLAFSFLTILVICLTLFIFFNRLPPTLPLLYSLPWGQDQLITKQQFFLLPGLILLITLFNWVISFYLHEIHLILKKLLMLNLILIDILLLVTFYKIITIFI